MKSIVKSDCYLLVKLRTMYSSVISLRLAELRTKTHQHLAQSASISWSASCTIVHRSTRHTHLFNTLTMLPLDCTWYDFKPFVSCMQQHSYTQYINSSPFTPLWVTGRASQEHPTAVYRISLTLNPTFVAQVNFL